jgi:YD repeat-containing protein
MKTPSVIRATVSFCVASLLVGCGTSQSTAPASIPHSAMPSNMAHKQSWMLRPAKSEDLLYVNAVEPSAEFGEVLVYTYPRGKFVGILGGFGHLRGLCSDTAGHVFVTSGGTLSEDPTIDEYSHGGNWLATLSLPGTPGGCAVDPTTGNLAVVTGGEISVYPDAQGEPVTYFARLKSATSCAYDAAGNLFVVGIGSNDKGELVEMPAGDAGTFQTIRVDKPISEMGAVQWDGADLAVQGIRPTIIYRMEVSQGRGKTVSRVRLVDAGNSDFWISGNTVARATGTRMKVGIWNYPEGGRHKDVTRQALPYQAFGLTVSLSSPRQH